MVSVPRRQNFYMYGGLTLPGLWQNEPVTSLSFLSNQKFEAFGSPPQAIRNIQNRLVTVLSVSSRLARHLAA